MRFGSVRASVLRLCLGLLTLLLAVMAGVTFVNYASSPTDENVFARTRAKMNLYVVRDIRAVQLTTGTREPVAPGEPGLVPSVCTGDLINLARGKPVYTPAELAQAVESVPRDSSLTLTIYRPERGIFLTYLVRRNDIPDSAFVVIKDFIEVTAVTPGGASDRAGMIVGDLIFRINDQSFKDEQEADLILRRGQAGKALTYEVLRKNQYLTLHVTLAKFGFPLALLVFCLSGMFMFSTGAFIALKRPQIRAARTLGLSLILLGYFLINLQIRRDPDPNFFSQARNVSVIVAFMFGTPMAFWAAVLFPLERKDLTARRWIPWVGYAIAVLGLIAAWIFGQFGGLAGQGAVIVYYIAVRIRFRKGATLEHKRLSRVIKICGISVGVVSAVSLAGITFWQTLTPFWIIGVALIPLTLSYLYTIGRYHLLDMHLRVKRNIQYSIVSIVWGVALAYALVGLFMSLSETDWHMPAIVFRGASVEVVDDQRAGIPPEWTNRFLLMSLGVGVWYGLWKVRKVGQAWIDKKYYRTEYDYRRAVSELGEVLARTLSMADLGTGLARRLAGLMQVKRAGVFFFREGTVSACHEASGIDRGEWVAFCTPVEHGLPAALAGVHEHVRSEYLPVPLADAFRAHEFHLLVPVRSKDRLLGAMVLGEKLSEATYREEDYAFLAAASQQAAVAMENAFLYEELAEKERMKHELDIARRIQLASLPQHTPALKGLDVAGVSVPAMEVGGDFFDYLNGAADRMTIVVGDVSGKGTSAALYMAKIQGILRSLHGFGLSPGDLFIRANRLLCGDMEKNSFVTAVGAAFDAQARTVVLARAGHLPLYHYHAAGGTVEKVTPRGLGLGLNNAGLFTSELEEKIVHYTTGDVLLFVTDGVTEAQNESNELYGEERLMIALAAAAHSGAAAIRDALMNAIDTFASNAAQHDDETMVVVKGTTL